MQPVWQTGLSNSRQAVRMLFDWLVTGQVVPMNSAAAVRGPKHVVKTGKTPVLDGAEWRKLIDSIPTGTVRDLRDRALIATTLTYSLARITAALRKICGPKEPAGGCSCTRKAASSTTPCRHALAEALRRYIDAAGIAEDKRAGCSTLPGTQRHRLGRAADDAGRRLAHDPPACGCGRHLCADRQSHVPCYRHHRLSRQWRRA